MNNIGSNIPHKLHLIGISGSGMAALAECLLQLGKDVSGSDLRLTESSKKLELLGARVYQHHLPSNVHGAELVVVSDAINSMNPEIVEARLLGIRVMRRAACLDLVASGKVSVMVAGSHGKSTTSAMIAWVLEKSGLQPSFALGASICGFEMGQANINSGEAFVVEACEAFRNLYNYHPTVAVITNIDNEHLDHYGGADGLENAFFYFASRATDHVILNGDDPIVQRLSQRLTGSTITFGFSPTNTLSASSYDICLDGGRFELRINGLSAGMVELAIPGRHVVMNSLACLAVIHALGIDMTVAVGTLSEFRGVNRRWQRHYSANGLVLFSDFAHHPSELAAIADTAQMVREIGQRIVIVFQPQLFSRTKRLLTDFALQLARFDQVYLLDIDAGEEKNISEISSNDLAIQIHNRSGHVDCFTDGKDFVSRIKNLIQPNDFVIVAGAGSIGCLTDEIAAAYAIAPLGPNVFLPDQINQPEYVIDVASAPSRISGSSVLSLFLEQVERLPDKYAFSDAFQKLTYSEFNAAADRLAFILRQRFSILPGDVVGVLGRPSIEVTISAVAIAKLGAVYLPITMNTPSRRVSFMLSQANAKLLISQHPDFESVPLLAMCEIEGIILAVDHHCIAINHQPAPSDIAYICFTSGSTGAPKGVPIHQAALENFVLGTRYLFGFNQTSRMLLNTSIGFDVSLGEIWMPLCSGGELCATDKAKPLSGTLLGEFLKRHQVSHIAITPSLLRTIPPVSLNDLICIISAGEACTKDLVDIWAKGRSFFNAYGPTEATIYATVSKCSPDLPVTIGQALPNVTVNILDKDLNPVSGSEVGELYLGGKGVADGYINLPDETKSKFVYVNGEKFYRTGDVAKFSSNFEIEYIGRFDNQIKILGNRIELEEVEQVLLERPEIVDAAAGVSNRNGIKNLVCFIVLVKPESFDLKALQEALTAWLPDAMMPSETIVVDRIPLTPNGKKNRSGLIARHQNLLVTRTDHSKPTTKTEKIIANLWRQILKVDWDIGIHEKFTNIGGDSLRALELIFEIERVFDISILPEELALISTISNTSVKVDQICTRKNHDLQKIKSLDGYSRVHEGLKRLTSAWAGERINDTSLIVSIGNSSAYYDFFLCVQSEEELKSFAETLGKTFRVHGMRSGHLLTNYNAQDTEEICSRYVKEIMCIRQAGKLILGGICQGGLIATRIVDSLLQKGIHVELLVLIEQAQLLPTKVQTAFFYSEDGILNPYKRFPTNIAKYLEIYGERFTLDIITGEHGSIHNEPQIHILCNRLKQLLGVEMPNQDDYTSISFDPAIADDVNIIAESYLFDAEYYEKQIGSYKIPHASLASHYLKIGWRHGYNPSQFFNTAGYLRRAPDVANAEMNPLLHFIRYGMEEGRTGWSDIEVSNWQESWRDAPEIALKQIERYKGSWPRLKKGSKIVIHVHSQGNLVFNHFQKILTAGFSAIGIDCLNDDETLRTSGKFGFFEPTLRIIIAPHEFFYLQGAPSSKDMKFSNILAINSEQIPSTWFAKSLKYLLKAQYVLDINLQTAACLTQLGVNSRYLPFGIIQQTEKTVASFEDRDIDILLIGTNSQRRADFISRNKSLFNKRNCIVRMVDVVGPLRENTPDVVNTDDFIKLAQRSKILLNIHHFNSPYFEWHRLMYFGFMQGCCVVTETVTQIEEFKKHTHFFQESIENLPHIINWLLDDEEGRSAAAQAGLNGRITAQNSFQLDRILTRLFLYQA